MKIQLILIRAIFTTLPLYVWGTLGAALGEGGYHFSSATSEAHTRRGYKSDNRDNSILWSDADAAKESVLLPNLGGLALQIEPDLIEGVFEAKNRYRVSVRLTNTRSENIELVHPHWRRGDVIWDTKSRPAGGQVPKPFEVKTIAPPKQGILNEGLEHTIVMGLGSSIDLGRWVPCKYCPCDVGDNLMQAKLPIYVVVTNPKGGGRSFMHFELYSNTLEVQLQPEYKPQLHVASLKTSDPMIFYLTIANNENVPVILLKPPVDVLVPYLYRRAKVLVGDQVVEPSSPFPPSQFDNQAKMAQLNNKQFVRIGAGESIKQEYNLHDYYVIPINDNPRVEFDIRRMGVLTLDHVSPGENGYRGLVVFL